MIQVTDNAVNEIHRIVSDQNIENKVHLRLRVVGGGCSGFKTLLDLDEVVNEENDEVFESNGVSVVIDKRSLLYVNGSTVDYYNDLNKMGFVVNNPLAVHRCGCGSSFSL